MFFMKAPYELVTLYRVAATTGDGEGRIVGTIGYYTKSSAAEHAASLSHSAPYTTVRQVPGLRVGNEYFHLDTPEPVEVNQPVEHLEANATRKMALAKLTEAEKIVLGLA